MANLLFEWLIMGQSCAHASDIIHTKAIDLRRSHTHHGEVARQLATVMYLVLDNRHERLGVIGRCGLGPGRYSAILKRHGAIGHHHLRVKVMLRPEAIARRACTKRVVEGEETRLNLFNREPRYRAGELF